MDMRGSLRKPTNWLRRLWRWTGWGLVGSVISFSLIPLEQPQIDIPNLDKFEHAFVYATLMVWFAQLHIPKEWHRMAFNFFAMGVILEILQGQTAYRTFSYWDIAANTLGILGGWFFASMGLSSLLTSLETRLYAKNTASLRDNSRNL